MINNLIGGKGDSASPENIDPNQLSIGIQVEMEHTNDPNIAKEIATDHLTEDPEYYTKLIKAGLADEFKPSHNSGFGDAGQSFNDPARLGKTVTCTPGNNIVGTIGNTPDGHVDGRRSDPIINKTIDIELQEKKKKKKKSKPKPTNSALWSRAKAMARAKFDVYPSAYANAWAARWYKKKGGGWRMSECDCGYDCGGCDRNKNPLNAFDGPAPAEVSPDGLGTYGSGYDFVGYAENKDITMKEQKLKEIIKGIIRKQLNEQAEGDDVKVDADQESVTVTLDRELAQRLHDLLMQQLTPEPSTETPTSPEATGEPESTETPEAPESPEATGAPESSLEPSAAPTSTPETPESPKPEDELKEGDKKKKRWIPDLEKGALHKQMGIPAGEKIPAGKLKAAAEKGGKLGKRARLAITLGKIAKKKKK